MRFTIMLFRQIFTPVTVIFAVIAGLLAAFVSALIEYVVLQEWLTSNGAKMAFLPVAIVTALEGTKLYLHFFNAAFRQNDLSAKENEALANFFKFLRIIQYALVGFSFCCSLIFTANAFYSQSVTRQSEELQEAQNAINNTYEGELTTETEAAMAAYNDAIASAKNHLDKATLYWESIEIIRTPLREFQRTTELKEAAWSEVEKAQAAYDQVEKVAREDREARVRTAEQELTKKRDAALAELDQSTLGRVAGDNVFLRNFLLFIFTTLIQKEYPRWVYLIFVFFISLAISGLLEGVILLSQYVISFPPSVLEKLSEGCKITQLEKEKLTRVVQVAVSIMLALAIFLIYGLIQEIVYTATDIKAAIIVTCLTVIIPSIVTATAWSIPATAQHAGLKTAVKDTLDEIRSTVIKGLLSFGGFILIGLFFGEDFAALTMPAVGIAVGNSIGHLFHVGDSNWTAQEKVA